MGSRVGRNMDTTLVTPMPLAGSSAGDSDDIFSHIPHTLHIVDALLLQHLLEPTMLAGLDCNQLESHHTTVHRWFGSLHGNLCAFDIAHTSMAGSPGDKGCFFFHDSSYHSLSPPMIFTQSKKSYSESLLKNMSCVGIQQVRINLLNRGYCPNSTYIHYIV